MSIDLARAAQSVQLAAKATGPKGAQKSSVVPELSGPSAGLPGWSHFLPPEHELNEQWVGHQRIETVESMLNHWQVAAVRQVVRLPAHRYIIELDPQDADHVTVDLIAADVDVPVLGSTEAKPGRRSDLFSARRHLDRALDALDYGHAVFEHTGYIDAAGYWRLKDLPPVPQWTIADQNSWEIDRHGRVKQVIQWGSTPAVKLPVDNVVIFTWQGRPGDPRGRSMLRPLTGAWAMSDRIVRVMGMSAERTGMGIPVGKVGTGAVAGAKEKMSTLLGGMAAGHDSHLVLDTDEDIRREVMLMGVTGQTPDLVSMLRYLDEVMARAMLAMLLQLGQTESGSRALGLTFDALLAMFHDAVLNWYCDTMQAQLVERWVDRNRPTENGARPPVPKLVWRRAEDEEPEDEPIDSTAEDVDEPARAPVAARRGVRSAGGARGSGLHRETEAPSLEAQVSPGAALVARQRATRAAFMAVAGRDLRRDPSDTELAAGTDFATIEQQFVTTRESVASALLTIREELARRAVEEVAAMAEVDPLTVGDVLAASLEQQAEDMDSAPLIALLVAFAAAGVNQVVGEAARQGVSIAASIDYGERATADAADLMRRMARQVAESAASAARSGVPAGLSGGPASDVIAEHLQSLTAAAAEQAAAGATSRAQNAGRAAGIAAGQIVALSASEILDVNTCSACLVADGRVYSSLDEALLDYPAGGFHACEGRERCRGLLFALFEPDGEA